MSPDNEDLWETTEHVEGDGEGLQRPYSGVSEIGRNQETAHKDRVNGQEQHRAHHLSTVQAQQDHDDEILEDHEERLSVRAKRVACSKIVSKGDGCGKGFQKIREATEALCGARKDDLDNLRHLDHHGARDDSQAETL